MPERQPAANFMLKQNNSNIKKGVDSQMKTVRFGVVGIGNMGGGHVSSLLDGKVSGGVLTAVCDIDPAKINGIKERHPDIALFASADEMLESGKIDAVIIATPHYDHPPIAIGAFARGIHDGETCRGIHETSARDERSRREIKRGFRHHV